MDEDRVKAAAARIDAALVRMERAAQSLHSARNRAGMAELQDRHDRLRHSVSDALAQLDTILVGTRS